ncbi:hypothetical protein MNQ95_15320 [Pseudoxanthomonas daejeonensis]|uniref:hypothetical protein n=1 Tax=Pseudoxanthomonas daejeonensis TaxID=266062 RepID=UPI001F543A3C|nr:hypothetical protein [Pseudoxanthomonas daejeonensis]UNK57472.1 hypothetical protein MNQ95_15320 [Pseudoxanthomonas daejeonensis]
MIDLDPTALTQAIALSGPLNVRAIGFDIPSFDLLKGIQRRPNGLIRRNARNAEVLKHRIHTRPKAGSNP